MTLFSNYLRKKELKLTNQRLRVAENIFCLQSHFTVESLVHSLREKYGGEISRATVYRIVSHMVEGEQLIEHNFGGNVKYYEHLPHRQHHDHIVCNDCGRIEEFVDEKIEKMQIDITRRLGFKLTSHALILHGDCREMLKKGKCTKSDKKK